MVTENKLPSKDDLKLKIKRLIESENPGNLDIDKLASILANLDLRLLELEKKGAAIKPIYIFSIAFFSIVSSVLIILFIILLLMTKGIF